MKRAHYLQHVPFEGPGALQPWLVEQGWALTCTRLYLGESLPSLDGVDFVFVLGGPMSVNEESAHPWIREERAWLREALDSSKPLLGVCLGAQMMASALGASVSAGREPEIGWFPLVGHDSAAPCYRFPTRFEALHWHGETFAMPAGAELLASSEACAHQAFQYGAYAIGVQFHLETTRDSLEELILHGEDELSGGPFVQDAKRMRAVSTDRLEELHEAMGDLLAYLLRDVH